MGFRRFSFRGLKKVEAKWTLVCLALGARSSSTVGPLPRSRSQFARCERRLQTHPDAFPEPLPRASGTTTRSSLAVSQLDALTKSVTLSEGCVERVFSSVR